jgi:hypothetical protein
MRLYEAITRSGGGASSTRGTTRNKLMVTVSDVIGSFVRTVPCCIGLVSVAHPHYHKCVDVSARQENRSVLVMLTLNNRRRHFDLLNPVDRSRNHWASMAPTAVICMTVSQ